MRRKGNMGRQEPPTIVADLNGNVIYLNNRAKTDLYPIKIGNSISKYVDLNYIRKLSVFDNRIDVVVPTGCKFEKVVVKIVGTGATKTVELCFFHSTGVGDDEITEDKKLFSAYAEIIGKGVTGSVKLNDLVLKVIDAMQEDLRFAYRKFEFEKSEVETDLYVNFNHLSTLIVGMIIALNEIEYRNPIKISVDKILGDFVFSISVSTNTFQNTRGLHEFMELYPKIAMRLMFLTSLCDADGIDYDFLIRPNEIKTSFVITEMINKTGKFSASSFVQDQKAFVSYVMDIFMPNTLKAEQE